MASPEIVPECLPTRPRHGARRWLNSLAAIVLVGEVVFVFMIVRQRGLFDYIGLDYRGTRSAGKVILEHGLGSVYNPSLHETTQRRLYDRYVHPAGRGVLPFYIVPAPYPPPFSLAFVPSTLLAPVPGFLVWTIFHGLVLVLYQIRLARAFGVDRPGWLIVAVILSPPAFIHLLMGQISVWIMVFFGEAVIAFDGGRRLKAGVWLGLMVLKPQALVLLIPALAITSQWRVLLGMGVAALATVVPTLLVAGDWITSYARFLKPMLDASGAVMASFPTSMSNWRAFALNSAHVVSPVVAWGVAGIGIALTGTMGFACARSALRGGDRFVVSLGWLGLAAATNACTWHAHVHQSLLLVPPLYSLVAARPNLQMPVEAVFLALAIFFVIATFATSVGLAHDLLGTALFAALVTATATCAFAIRNSVTDR
jgi:hypothetical protein